MTLDRLAFSKQLLLAQRSYQIGEPVRVHADRFIRKLLAILFPQLGDSVIQNEEEYTAHFDSVEILLQKALTPTCKNQNVQQIVTSFMRGLPGVYEALKADAQAINQGDPAATGIDEVIHTYPGFLAIAIHRIAHELALLEVQLLPRVLAEYAHERTGIDIHPTASIGQGFCIDHGTGIVIGATTIIKDNVRVYQGVTLGGLIVKKELAGKKRHPTIEENVVIYANATILGGDTVIGKNSIIGGNVWLTSSVPDNSIVYHEDASNVRSLRDSAAKKQVSENP